MKMENHIDTNGKLQSTIPNGVATKLAVPFCIQSRAGICGPLLDTMDPL